MPSPMQLAKIQFKAGIIKDDSALAAEGGWVDSDKMRFWRGQPQTIGGWQLLSTETFSGIARGAHDWTDLNGNPLMAWGTASKLYALVGGAQVDITPSLAQGVLSNPFSTVIASPIVTVNHPLHGFATGNTVTFTNASPVGGLVLNGTYVVSVVNVNSYTITAASNATATVTSGTAGTVDFVAPLPAGNVDGLAIGYGSGAYGSGPYGATVVTDTDPRIWSLDNFGENLLANPRGGGLYEWQPSFSVVELVLNGGFDTDTAWAKGTGWTISGGVANKAAGTASLLTQNLQNLVTPGKTYQVTFTVSLAAGTLKFRTNAGSPTPAIIDVGTASTAITQSGTYTRNFRAPASLVDMVFSADAAFAGTIDNVSVKLANVAYRIDEAPRNIDFMFVDPNRFVVCLACQETDGDYNPLLVRWSDQENSRVWVADDNNLAGEISLSSGGRALSGLAARQQNLIWTDNALFSMTLTGAADSVFSFKLLGTGCGIIGRNAAVEHNGIAFWQSPSGYYIFQGAIPQKIDCSVERDVFDNLAPLQSEKIYAGVNAKYSEIWWLTPDARDGVGIECSRAIVYNFIEQHWTTHAFDRTSWLSAGIFSDPTAFSAMGLLFSHEIGQTANGNPIGSYLQTAFFDVEDGNNLMNILRIAPDFEGQVGSVSFTMRGRPFPNGPEWVWGPYVATPTTQKLDMRRTARQISLRLQSSEAPSFWRLGVPRLGAEKSGALR